MKDNTPRLHKQTSVPRSMPRSARHRGNTDTVKLLMLGYRQELEREFTLFNSFGSGFTALSSLAALGGTYYIGLAYGGPVVMMWGWFVVVLFTTSVGLSMAELASAYPTSGALYYWSYKMAPLRLKNLACWMTAWILTISQAALCASSFYTFVDLVCTAVNVQYSVELTPLHHFAVLLTELTVIGILNCGSARLTAFMTTLGTFWHIIATGAVCVSVPLMAPERQSAKYVFTSWQPHYSFSGLSNPAYVTLVGLLMAQWTLTGYDGAAHLAEETLDADIHVPQAIMMAIGGGSVAGYAMMLSLTFVKMDVEVLLDPNNETGGTNVVLQILINITKATHGSVLGGVTMFSVFIVGTFLCSNQLVANNSRMLYAFARDNGVPLAAYAERVHPRTRTPVCAALYMLFLTGLLATPMCFNTYIFPAVTSFAVVGCYLSYALPVLCKVCSGRRYFLPGPFTLGPRLSYYNNVLSLLWVVTVTVLFTLPQFYPITLLNMNWSAPILGLVLMFSLGWYYFPIYGARTWFLGPRANLGQFNDILPSDLARLAGQEHTTKPPAQAGAPASDTTADPAPTSPPLPPASAHVASTADLEKELQCRLTGGIIGTGPSFNGRSRLSRRSLAIATPARSAHCTPTVTANGLARLESPSLTSAVSALVQGLKGPTEAASAPITATAAPATAAGVTAMTEAQASGRDMGFCRTGTGTGYMSQVTLSDGTGYPSRSQSRHSIGSPMVRYTPTGAVAARGKTRRLSAISLLEGPPSCGSHIAQLLQGEGLEEDEEEEVLGDGEGPPVSGGPAVRSKVGRTNGKALGGRGNQGGSGLGTSCCGDGRLSSRADRPAGLLGRRPLMKRSRTSLLRIEPWVSGGFNGVTGSGGGGSGTATQERASFFNCNLSSQFAIRRVGATSSSGGGAAAAAAVDFSNNIGLHSSMAQGAPYTNAAINAAMASSRPDPYSNGQDVSDNGGNQEPQDRPQRTFISAKTLPYGAADAREAPSAAKAPLLAIRQPPPPEVWVAAEATATAPFPPTPLLHHSHTAMFAHTASGYGGCGRGAPGPRRCPSLAPPRITRMSASGPCAPREAVRLPLALQHHLRIAGYGTHGVYGGHGGYVLSAGSRSGDGGHGFDGGGTSGDRLQAEPGSETE